MTTESKRPSERDAANRAPLVSIVIPAYNVADYIGQALDSVMTQTVTDFEVIVVNDGSPETETLERVLEPFRSRIVYIRQENRGVSGARNTGIRVARGEFYAQLDPDDIWQPNYLATQLGVLQADPTADLVYPNAVFFGDGAEVGRSFMELCPSDGEVTLEKLLRLECTVMTSVTARREAIVRAGMYDEAIKTAEDFDLWLRVAQQGSRIVYHRTPLVRYRQRAGSLSADPIRMLRNALAVFDKLEQSGELNDSVTAALAAGRSKLTANLRLCEGKNAFILGDVPGAIAGLSDANTVLQSRRTALQVRLLRWCPGLLLRAYQWRERYWWKHATRY
ncbi:MAG: glycosyltransferase family A protein [Pyrinomonadaceae bacterium]